MNELDPTAVIDPNAPGLPPAPFPRPKPVSPPVTREAVIADEDVPVPNTATSVPFFSEDNPVMPLPENVVELVTVTVVVVPARVVTVKVDADTAATVPLTCGAAKPDGRVPPAGPDPLGIVELGAVAAGDDFDERLAVTRPATTPTATTSTATINHVVRRLRSRPAVPPHSSDLSCPLLRRPRIGRLMFPAVPVRT